ncbi:hypothetical protein [Novosphingobium sp. ST904]|uniref:hypothetical protein n=1 Tax=Novosphingobium sp. ST904 TaxID=1684385 RepID=UPI0006C880C2|nr:hypothetical protein [Novosphingobium sp. ST904]KPH66881.1 hypothetical protein ADT71_03755 [Novosphingobium sp. ST904]TCM39122.1 hypothetical protein EDF59_1061 [Novosphingobium sp. ST904]
MSAHDVAAIVISVGALALSGWNFVRLGRARRELDALEIRVLEIVWREIDADAVWKAPEPNKTYAAQRSRLAAKRKGAIVWGQREDTGV